ncbi:hypothetical protein J6590_077274 [Homalodisca vitripennis]|nr:hypothetical protein J6590_077274 [Homalodisca vitripennis]
MDTEGAVTLSKMLRQAIRGCDLQAALIGSVINQQSARLHLRAEPCLCTASIPQTQFGLILQFAAILEKRNFYILLADKMETVSTIDTQPNSRFQVGHGLNSTGQLRAGLWTEMKSFHSYE